LPSGTPAVRRRQARRGQAPLGAGLFEKLASSVCLPAQRAAQSALVHSLSTVTRTPPDARAALPPARLVRQRILPLLEACQRSSRFSPEVERLHARLEALRR
jgi:hypothetical protein